MRYSTPATTSLCLLPLASRHSLQLARLPFLHKDPFDRMLVAQCIADDLVLVTGDRQLSEYPIETIR